MKDDTLVKTAMEFMHSDFKPILEGMLKHDNISTDKSVREVLDHFEKKELTNSEGIAITALVGALSKSQMNKFRRKLDFAQQCAALGLIRLGYTREHVGTLYDIDRRTVTHIYNSRSPHYKSVREEEKTLGGTNFIEKYVTPEVRAAAESVKSLSPKEGNNPNANGKRGLHTVRNPMCNYDHRILIQWRDPSNTPNIPMPGWYYCDLDSEWPDDWFHCGPESMKNSQACFNAAQNDISDKIS